MAKRKRGMTFIPYDYEAAYNKSLEDIMNRMKEIEEELEQDAGD